MTTTEIVSLLAMIGTCVAAIAACVTLFFARAALTAWKEQEVLKSKKDFKMALLDLKAAAVWQPELINKEHLRIGRNILYSPNGEVGTKLIEEKIDYFKGLAVEFEKLETAMQSCSKYWNVTEGVFSGTSTEKLWGEFCESYNNYTQGKEDLKDLISKLDVLIEIKFYFHSAT
ncbi:hypothetical protein [Kluyvera sichuanensis]